ncbi:MAG: polysaccharide deacetylase family protein [Magnetococcales bacterium]|nr:polysaccharide deacetylase family protein [Magnetococcales bacterium]
MALLLVASVGWAGPKHVYLTFDDGPREGTRKILELLTREEVPATFFLVGDHLINDERREIFQKLKESPRVQLANHSLTHAHERYQTFYANPEGMLKDFLQNNTVLGFTQPPYFTRLPGRIDWRFGERYIDTRSYPNPSTTPVPTGIAKLHQQGFVIYGWDVEWSRPGRKVPLESVETVLTRICKRLESGQLVKPGHLVLLMHDFHFNTPEAIDALQTLIWRLKADDREFGLMRDY